MKRELNIFRDLKIEYFWDVNIEKLDIDSARRLIIERVFTLGSVKEILLVSNSNLNNPVNSSKVPDSICSMDNYCDFVLPFLFGLE